MACSSNPCPLDPKQDSCVLDPLLSSWMSRDAVAKETNSQASDEEENKRKDRDSESEIRELFRIFDKNHDNTISCAELEKMLTCMGKEVTEEEVEVIMRDLDKNGNGKIEYREFKAFMQDEMKRAEESPMEQERAIRLAFQVFDKTGDGLIDGTELRSAMKRLGEPLSEKEISEMMNEACVDTDGKVNYGEFIKNWLSSGGRRK